MRGAIKSNGSLILCSENETEEYALVQWMKESVRHTILWAAVVGEDGGVMLIGRLEPPLPRVAETFTHQGFSIQEEEK